MVRASGLGFVLALGLGAAASNADAFCRSTTSASSDPTMCPTSGAPLSWTGGCASLSVDPRNLPSTITLDVFRQTVQTAANAWAVADCGGAPPSFHFVPFADCPHGAEWNASGANANTVSFRTHWGDDAFHAAGAIAVTITTFNPNTGELRDSDTELNLASPTNPDGFAFTTDAPSPTAADLPTVLTHELGHAQGLAHSPIDTAVMWFRAGLGEQRRTLQRDDIDGICAIYPSGRAATCDPTPHGGFECAPPGCSCGVPGASPKSRGVGALALLSLLLMGRRRPRFD